MTSSNNPFFNTDFSDFMDPQKIAASFQGAGFNANAWTEIHRKNLETIAEANRICFEGLQAAGQRQAEIIRQSLEEAVEAVSALAEQGAPEKRAALQIEMVKQSYEKMLANLRELSEINSKSTSEAAEKINRRIAANLDELGATLQEMSAGQPASKGNSKSKK